MMLDEACTSISFMRDGVLHAIRTIPNGFGSVLSSYMTITNLEIDECLDMIRSNGVHVPDERFDMPAIQDDVLRTLNRLTGEVVKTLHSTFGDEAVIDHVLLCGNFTRTVGLVEYLNTMLDTECAIAGADTLKSGAASAIVLNEADLEAMFPLAATTAKGADLMSELKKHKADKVKSIALCSLMTVAVAGMMIVTPVTKNNLQKERDASAALMSQPEYMAVQELFDTKTELNRYKSDLAEAIEALPHGQTASASIVGDLVKITTDYGTVLALSTDYNAKTISLSFTTLNYDSFVYWQKQIAEGGRFSFLEPPTFSGNGLIFTVEANMTATDFDMTKPEAEVPEETTAETAEAPEETTAETTEGMG